MTKTRVPPQKIQEAEFFNSSPWSSDKSRVSIFALKARLIELLNETTRREYPRVDQEIARQLTERERKLPSLGPGRETYEQQRKYLLGISTNRICAGCAVRTKYTLPRQ